MYLENVSLKHYNTFGVDAKAKKMAVVHQKDELVEILDKNKDILPLGGGSNMLFVSDVDKLVVKMETKGIVVEQEKQDFVQVRACAGENWHNFVRYCVEKGWSGIENLALIPGSVGAAPVQNIGAYGVELKDVFFSCKAIGVDDLKEREFTKQECEFGYRDSIFKKELRGKYIITEVCFNLKKNNHNLVTSYGKIEEKLKEKGVKNPEIKNVYEAVIGIRKSKIPSPKEIGSAGSFFKNPVVEKSVFERIKKNWGDIPFFQVGDMVKIPAAWLIEKCGLKGYRTGDAGLCEKQPLILVNYGNASGKQIYELSQFVVDSVREKFEIELEREVNIVG